MLACRSWKQKSKNIVLNFVYPLPNGDHKELENYFKSSLSKQKISKKDIILAGDSGDFLVQTKTFKSL